MTVIQTILNHTIFNQTLRLICTSLCVACTSAYLFAQPYSNPVGTALGGANVLTSHDVDAIGSNPALLMPLTLQSSTNTLIFTLGALGGIAGESALNLSEITTYFGTIENKRRLLSDAELRTFSSLLDGSRIGGQVDATLLAAVLQTSIGAFAISAGVRTEAGVQLPQGLAQLLQGYDASQKVSLVGMGASAFSYGNFQIGYANHIVLPEMADSTNTLASLRVGGAVQYIVGYAFEELSNARLSFSPVPVTDFPTTSYNIRANLDYTLRSVGTALLTDGRVPKDPLSLVQSPAGNGVGASLGAVASVRLPGSKVAAWQLGVSLTDIGIITWNAARVGSVSFQDTIKSILPLVTDSTFVRRLRDTTNRRETITRGLPARLNIGFTFDYGAYFNLTTPLMLSFQYSQGLNESGFNTTVPRFALGLAWENKDWIPSLRTGIAIGGQEEIRWSCGLGWNVADAFMIDAAVANLLPLLNTGKGTWLGGSLRLKGRITW
jgi:hypothetical protein